MAKRLPFQSVLVTGANGFVGRHLLPCLAGSLDPSANLALAIRDRDPADDGNDAEAAPNRTRRVHFDLCEPSTILDAVAETRPDLIIHLAGQASVGRSGSAAGETWSANLSGSLALAEAIGRHVPDSTTLFVSSAEVYGLSFNGGTARESTPLLPQSPYARSKAAAEAMFTDVLPPTARLIVVRPTNHSGPGQSHAFVVPAFAQQIAQAEQGGTPVVRVGNLDAARDFLDVRDVVAAYMSLIAHAGELPMRSIFNVASGQAIRIGELLDLLISMARTRIVVEPDQARLRPSEVASAAGDASALRKATSWSRRYSVQDMLASVLDDARSRAASARRSGEV